MTPDLIRYYEDRLTMFAGRGWKDLIEDVTEMVAATNRLDGVTPETLPYKQGELSMMNWLLSLERTSKQAYAEMDDAPIHMAVPSGAPDGTHLEIRNEDAE